MKDKTHFVRFANWTASAAGRAQTFVLACAIIVGWALTGPLFDYSDSWQLVLNTRSDDHHHPDGVRHPEHSKPRQQGDADQT